MFTHKFENKDEPFSPISSTIESIEETITDILQILDVLVKTNLNFPQTQLIESVRYFVGRLNIYTHLLVNDTKDNFSSSIHFFSLKKLLYEVVEELSIQKNTTDVALVLEVDEQISDELIGDQTVWYEFMVGLLKGSMWRTNQGFIKLQCRLKSSTFQNETIEFSITDTSEGMRKEELKKILQHQSSSDTQYLDLAQQWIEQIGGRLTIQSEWGFGTRINGLITFKKYHSDNLKMQASNHHILQNIHILLVEDLEMNQLIAQNVLENWGASVEIAENGQEAINKINEASTPFDLVLMDIQMPVMDGIQATQIIRQELRVLVPIIALSANTHPQDKEDCKNVGMQDFVQKPFNSNELLLKILHAVGRPKIGIQPHAPLFSTSTFSLRKSFDLTKLRKMCEQNEVMLNKMLEAFTLKTPPLLHQLSESFKQKNWEQLSQTAHKLKASIDLIGIEEIRLDIRQVEACQKNQLQPNQIAQYIQHIHSVCQDVIAQIRQDYLQGNQSSSF